MRARSAASGRGGEDRGFRQGVQGGAEIGQARRDPAADRSRRDHAGDDAGEDRRGGKGEAEGVRKTIGRTGIILGTFPGGCQKCSLKSLSDQHYGLDVASEFSGVGG